MQSTIFKVANRLKYILIAASLTAQWCCSETVEKESIGPALPELTLRTEFGSTSTCDYRIAAPFVIWWDRKYDHVDDAEVTLKELLSVRDECVNQFGMKDPPNVERGNYINIYIHHGKKDLFPSNWNNGVSTDRNKNVFLMLPAGMHKNLANLSHEGFHLFQYRGTVKYKGDSGWYTEASANWFSAKRHPNDVWAYVGASALVHHPQLPIWHSGYFNREEGEPHNWGRGMHNYGMNAFLNWLTGPVGLEESVVASVLYADGDQTPQERLYQSIGPEAFTTYWIHFVSELAIDYGVLSGRHAGRAEKEWQRLMGDQNDDQRYVKVFNNTGTNGDWLEPDREHVTKGWGYNVYKVINNTDGSYVFHLDGDTRGDDKTRSIFRGRVGVKSSNGKRFYDLDMANNRDGNVRVYVTPEDEEIYFVVAAVPEKLSGNERYYYKVKIDAASSSARSANK